MQQLDLFRDVPAPAEPPPSDEVTQPVIGLDSIEDEELLAALPRAGLGAKLPAATVLELLHHYDPQVRADACRFAQAAPDMVAQLRDLLDDLQHPVRMAAACALGLIGRNEVRPRLTCYRREEPSAQIIDAVVPVANEECFVLLGRIARTMPDLSVAGARCP